MGELGKFFDTTTTDAGSLLRIRAGRNERTYLGCELGRLTPTGKGITASLRHYAVIFSAAKWAVCNGRLGHFGPTPIETAMRRGSLPRYRGRTHRHSWQYKPPQTTIAVHRGQNLY